jgi:acylphosphatase
MSEEIVEMHALIKGEVQGVGFRAVTLRIAQHLGLRGSVKNLDDGSVEIIAQGTQQALQQLQSLLEQHFQPGLIRSFTKQFYPPSKIYSSFQVLIV